MTRKLIAVLTFVAVVALCWPYGFASEEPQDKLTKKIMEEKMKNAHKLLDGIALADFKRITDSTEELLRLSTKEEWLVLKTPKYELFNNEFQRAADNIIAKAKVKNIEGVTLAYFELTMSCVRCHTYVREVRGG